MDKTYDELDDQSRNASGIVPSFQGNSGTASPTRHQARTMHVSDPADYYNEPMNNPKSEGSDNNLYLKFKPETDDSNQSNSRNNNSSNMYNKQSSYNSRTPHLLVPAVTDKQTIQINHQFGQDIDFGGGS